MIPWDTYGQVDSQSITISIPVGNDTELEENPIVLYPNPGTGHYFLDISLGLILESWEVWDQYGKKQAHGVFLNQGQKQEKLVFEELPSGVYFLRIKAQSRNKTIKLVHIKH